MKARSAKSSLPVHNGSRAVAETTDAAELGRALELAERRLQEEAAHRAALEANFARQTAAERQHLRKQLHDGLGQQLTSMAFLLTAVRMKFTAHGLPVPEELTEVVSLLNDAIAESRAIAATCDSAPAPVTSRTTAANP